MNNHTKITIISEIASRWIEESPDDSPWESTSFVSTLAKIGIDPNQNELSLLDNIFRFFNRVGAEDSERLKEIGYRLPSMFVGDTITLDDRTWKVLSVGFEEQ